MGMAHPIEEFAAEAYAAGVALAGAPVTERIRIGAAAAVALAAENHDDPRILELTLHLGKLEGLWAVLFQRRQDLILHHTGLVAAAWRDLVTAEVIADTVTALRRDERSGDPDRWKEAVAAATTALIASLPGRPRWVPLRQALRDALAAGQAEGAAAAAVLVADLNTQDPPDWDTEYEEALAVTDRRHQLWADADTWLKQLLRRAARALAVALGILPDTDDSALQDTADQALDEPADFTVDWAMTAAAAAGALAAYTALGQTLIAWTTAGDGRVCERCEYNEAQGPYPPIEFPDLPAHPGCRCQPTPA